MTTKANRGSRKLVGPLQALADRMALEETRSPLVNRFAAANGNYDAAGTLGVGRKVMVNRGGTPIARWKSAGLLTLHQEAAILHCIKLWQITDTSRSLVANLDRTVHGSVGKGNVAEIEARADLKRIEGGFPRKYWNVYERVCRFDEPAGVAGSGLAEHNPTAVTQARTIVCMVADMIYERERLSY